MTAAAAHAAAWGGKPVLDEDGRRKRDPATGKPSYIPALSWRSRELADGFSAALVEIIRQAHPGALG